MNRDMSSNVLNLLKDSLNRFEPLPGIASPGIAEGNSVAANNLRALIKKFNFHFGVFQARHWHA
jgi:hypothetical protein